MADIGASILAKLKNKAKASGMPYQQCLQLFFQEEFLRRLSKSGYAENFILKGGLFIYTLTNFESRATIDIDFLMRQMSHDLDHMDAVIEEIIATPTGNNDVVILSAKNTERMKDFYDIYYLALRSTAVSKENTARNMVFPLREMMAYCLGHIF